MSSLPRPVNHFASAEQWLSGYRERHTTALDRLIRSERLEWIDTSDDVELLNRIVDDLERVCRATRLHWMLDRQVIAALRTLTPRAGRPLRLVDVCCGNGWYLRHLARRLPAEGIECELIGVDRTAASIARAQQRSAGLSIDYLVGDATDLALASQSVDLVINCQSLHHFSPSAALAMLGEARRIGQALFVFDVRRTPFGVALAWLCRPITSASFVHDAALSTRRAYRIEELSYLFERADLPLAIRRLTPFGLAITSS